MKIIRSKKNGYINVKSTLKSFQSELDKRVKDEDRIREDKTLKDAVNSVMEETKGFEISDDFLAVSAVRKLFHTGDNYENVLNRVRQHIRLNRYLKANNG